jgi:hypothetical protein
MAPMPDNETWLINEGDRIIQKKANSGVDHLTPCEKLVYSLWVADYAMRNGEDLEQAKVSFLDFQTTAVEVAEKLNMPVCCDLFSMTTELFEEAYLDSFDGVCNEIRAHSC